MYDLPSPLMEEVKKITCAPFSFFDNTKSGALVSRIMSDVEGVRNLIGTGLVQLVGGTITAVISMILLIQISPAKQKNDFSLRRFASGELYKGGFV